MRISTYLLFELQCLRMCPGREVTEESQLFRTNRRYGRDRGSNPGHLRGTHSANRSAIHYDHEWPFKPPTHDDGRKGNRLVVMSDLCQSATSHWRVTSARPDDSKQSILLSLSLLSLPSLSSLSLFSLFSLFSLSLSAHLSALQSLGQTHSQRE
jgi:hypothetical protein